MSFSLSGLLQRGMQDIGLAHAPAPQPQAVAQLPSQGSQFSPRAQQVIMARNPVQGAQQIAHGVNMPSFNQQPIYRPPQMSTPTISPQAMQSLTHAKYGVLANNPSAQQRFINSKPMAVKQPNLLQQNLGAVEHAAGNTVNALSGHSLYNAGTGLVQFVPQFSENYNNAFANLGNRAAGRPNQTIQQNQGGDPFSNKLLKFSGATGTNKQLAGDVAQVALASLPGVGKGASLAAKAGVGATIGAGFNAASTAGNGGTTKDIIKSGAIGAALGGALPVVGHGLHQAASPVINKAVTNLRTNNILPPSSLNPNELSALSKFHDQAGTGTPMDDATYQNGVAAANKAGINYQDPNAVGGLLNAHQNYDTAVQQSVKTVLANKAKAVVPAIKNAGSSIADSVKKADQAAFTPRASIQDQQVLHDYTNLLTGANPAKGAERNTLISNARAVGNKHGIDLTNGSVADQVDGAKAILDRIGQQTKAVTSRFGIKPLDQTGAALLKEDGSVIPTLKKALGKGEPAVKQNPSVASSSDGSIAPKTSASPTNSTPQLPSEVKLPQEPAKPQTDVLPKTVSSADSTASPRSKQSGVALSKPSTMNADSYARTFGVSKEDAVKSVAEVNKPVKAKSVSKQRQVIKRTAEQNTAANPVKVSIPKVEPGNFEQARINPQLASHPIQYATGEAVKAQKGLGLNTSDFAKMVEGTSKPTTPAEVKAVNAYKDMTNQAHATSQALGGNTGYVPNYFRHEWDLSKPEDAAKFNDYVQKAGNHATDPYGFAGIDNQPRVFKSVAQGEALGFKLKNQNVVDEINKYGSGSSHALKQQALAKGALEADALPIGADSSVNRGQHVFDLGQGKSITLSNRGMHQMKGYTQHLASQNPVAKAYRTGNRGFKQALLSLSEFHPINISVLKAGPALALRGHPLMAAKGVFDTFATQADRGYSNRLQAAAFKDGTITDSARIGTPIKFGSDYKTEGKIGFGKGGIGEKAIFEHAMPAMHIQMVKGAVADLRRRNLSLDSPEAHALGNSVNELMGFMNTEVRNLDKRTQRSLGDVLLAPQFTRAKWNIIRSAMTDTGLNHKGLAGGYARAGVAGNAAAVATAALVGGYFLKQKSDNTNDVLLRSIFHPSIPTPLKDSKGNTEELAMPASYSSEALGLAGFSLTRGSDGHLHVTASPTNIPGNAANYGRSRLAVIPGTALKIATDTNFANKPLYDKQAPLGVKAQQAATTIGTGLLPIGGQGLAQNKSIDKHLPTGVQQILATNSPGSDPVVKSIGSAFGLTPKTDKTVGKGLQTTQYFAALDAAKKGLNANDTAAYNAIHPTSKNPVTGAYQVQPTIYDSQQRATSYLKNPNVLAADNKLNTSLKNSGQTIDPFFDLSSQQQRVALNYSALAPGDYRRSNFLKAYPFLNQLSNDRNSFFSGLPQTASTDTAGNSKPQLPGNLQYPKLSTQEQGLLDKYYAVSSSAQRKNLIASDPATAAVVGKVKDYSAAIASARDIPTTSQIPNAPKVARGTSRTGTGRTSRAKGYGAASLAATYSVGRSNKALNFDKTLRSIASRSLKGAPRSSGSSKGKKVATYRAPSSSSYSKVKLGSKQTQPKKVFA